MKDEPARESFLSQVPAHLRNSVELLLKAQDEGLRVSISEGGVMGETVGRVSGVSIVNGKLSFKVDGEDYKAFYGVSVQILEKSA